MPPAPECLSLAHFFSTFTTVKDSRGTEYLDWHDPAHRAILQAAWRAAGPQRIWTWVDTPGYGGSAVVPGVHLVDRLAYLVTEEAWAEDGIEFWSRDGGD